MARFESNVGRASRGMREETLYGWQLCVHSPSYGKYQLYLLNYAFNLVNLLVNSDTQIRHFDSHTEDRIFG